MGDDFKDTKVFRDLGLQVKAFLNEDEEGLGDLEASDLIQSLDESRYHFTDKEFLVSGGEKTIYKVYDACTDRFVAIAQPKRHKTQAELEEFLRGARLAAKLQHPNILPVYEVGLDDKGIPYMVMRLLRRNHLGKMIQSGPSVESEIDQRGLLNIFLKACEGIIYAHSRGVLHLDLKPSNIMVGRHGQVTLIDWGNARVVRRQEGCELDDEAGGFNPDALNNIVLSGTFKGTPGFMAPEQISKKETVTPRTDVYALGAILYFILSGELPVTGESEKETIRRTMEGEISPLQSRTFGKRVPRSLEAIVQKALQLRPEDRYASVQDLHDDIQRYLGGFAPRAEKPGLLKRMQLFLRRHSLLAGMLSMFGFLMTVVIGIALINVENWRKEAIDNLELYKQETELSRDLYRDISAFFAGATMRGDILNDALIERLVVRELEALESGVASSSVSRRQVYVMKGYLHLINQEFNAARECLLVNFNPEYKLVELCSIFGAMKEDEELLTFAQLGELMNFPNLDRQLRLNLFSKLYERHMDKITEVDPVEYLPVAIGFLNQVNDQVGWGEDIRLEERDRGYHLDLSGAPYSAFAPSMYQMDRSYGILVPLQLVSLDLSGSLAQEFRQFKVSENFEDLILLDVNLFNSPITAYWLGETHIKRIIIRKGAIDPDYIVKHLSHVDIIQLDPGEEWEE